MRLFALGGLTAYLFLCGIYLASKSGFDELFLGPLQGIQNSIEKSIMHHYIQYPGWAYRPARDDTRGAVLHNPERIWGDLTLFVSVDENVVKLVDQDGEKVHTWSAAFHDLWPNGNAFHTDPVSPEFVAITRAWLAPEMNGDIYVEYTASGEYIYEYGRARLDRDSNVLSRIPQPTHHDMAFLPDGNIASFLHEIRVNVHPAMPKVRPPLLDEFLVIQDRNGKELRRKSLISALADAGMNNLLKYTKRTHSDLGNRDGDILHPNTVTLIPDAVVGKAPMLKKNHAILCIRNFNMLATVDLETLEIDWMGFGPWRQPHDPEFLPNGNIVLFDNFGHVDAGGPGGGGSRVIQVDLNDMRLVWEYGGTPDKPLFSAYNGMVEVLPNGNILVTETERGRIFEITQDKEIVWEYFNPKRVRNPEDDVERIPAVFTAQRFRREDLRFLADQAPAAPIP